MSPLVSAPNRGYADWQRLSNMDTGVLFNQVVAAQNAPPFSPIIDVSRYEFLGGQAFMSNGQANVRLQWYADAAGAVTMGQRSFQLTSQIPAAAQLRLPNLGPFVQWVWSAPGVSTFSGTVNLIATNRYHPLEFVPTSPVLFQLSGGAAPVNNTIYMPNDYYAGPVSYWYNPAYSTGFLQLQWLDNQGNWQNIYSSVQTAANTETPGIAVTPPGAWRIVTFNGSGVASTHYIGVVQSQTGST